jgi:hypothetical protein
MLFLNIDFENKNIVEKFKIQGKHSATWNHYYACYAYCLNLIISIGLQRDYSLNSKARCILFLCHHFFELGLKYNLITKGIFFVNNHKLDEIGNIYKENNIELPNEFYAIIQIFKTFDKIGDGSCWRYLQDNDNNFSFSTSSQFNLAIVIQKYSSIKQSEVLDLKSISEKIDFLDKRTIWDLTFQLHECRYLGQLRTQYDSTVEFLLEGIVKNNFSFDLMYLPILFLIRHSLELGLKDNIQEIQSMSNLIKQTTLTNEHSLFKLYKYFDDFLSQIDINQLDGTSKLQLIDFRVKYSKLNGTIHDLDSNSLFFRYPVDKKGNKHDLKAEKLNFINVLRLYYFTDPFISFTTAVLVENGILTPKII